MTIQEEEAAVEVMYSEMSDLLSKLDGQIHELHQYYSLRPDLHSLTACDKVPGASSLVLSCSLIVFIKSNVYPFHFIRFLTTVT